MLKKIYDKLVKMCANGETDTQKLCDMADTAALQYDCLCGPGCEATLESPLVKADGSILVPVGDDNNYVVGQNVAFYNAGGDIQGGAVISGAGETDTDAGVIKYPVSDCTVADEDAPTVAEVKPVLESAATAVKNIALKKLAARSVKEATPVRG